MITRPLLRRLCLDTLYRTPTRAETRAYLGAPIPQITKRLQHSREAARMWLEEELYYYLLLDNFRPRSPNIHTLPERLTAGKISLRDATAEIMLSTGFSLRNPGNDTFVTVVLEQALGLTVQDRKVTRILEAGKRMYDGKRTKLFGTRGSSQSDVIRIVLQQPAFCRHALDRHHRRLFERPLPKDDPAIQRLIDQPLEFLPILTDWLQSKAYRDRLEHKRPMTDRQFVRSLYCDLLGREPTFQQLRNMRNALQSMADPTPLRSVMVKLILDSKQKKLPAFDRERPDAFVATCFDRYLRRQPSERETRQFREILAEPGARPVLIVRALVGSTEYQYY